MINANFDKNYVTIMRCNFIIYFSCAIMMKKNTINHRVEKFLRKFFISCFSQCELCGAKIAIECDLTLGSKNCAHAVLLHSVVIDGKSFEVPFL